MYNLLWLFPCTFSVYGLLHAIWSLTRFPLNCLNETKRLKVEHRSRQRVQTANLLQAPIFNIVDSSGDNWSQNLITSSWGIPHRSRKFHQYPFITFRVSLILLTNWQTNATWWRLCTVWWRYLSFLQALTLLIRALWSNCLICVRMHAKCKKSENFLGGGTDDAFHDSKTSE